MTEDPQALLRRIQDSFDRQGLLATMGATLDQVAPGAVEISLPLGPALSQQQGFAHAGVAFSIGDSAAGYAAATLVAPEEDVVTSEMTIHLLSPAIGERLIARGSVIRPGRQMIIAQADVLALRDGIEKHVARLTGTMVRVVPR